MASSEVSQSRRRAAGRTAGARPSARSAAVRGDQYQYALAWRYACDAVTDPGVASISVEDPSGGHFDDVVVRRLDDSPDRYFQVKSSNSGSVAVDETWLTTPVTPAGRSPLQHFHATWQNLRQGDRPFELTLYTNRGIDNSNPILGGLRDNKDARVRVADLRSVTARSSAGQARSRWAAHLGVNEDELYAFLSDMRWVQSGPESGIREDAVALMRLAGLRSDDAAVELGIAYIRELVTDGVGPRTRDQLRDDLAARDMFAGDAELVLAVDAIDRPSSPHHAHARLDWVDRFDGAEARARYRTVDGEDWNGLFRADLQRVREQFEAYPTRRVHVTGAMRLAVNFAVGFELPDVRRWVLSTDQRRTTWRTEAQPSTEATASLSKVDVQQGEAVAVAVALSNDISDDVLDYLRDLRLPVSRLLVLTPEGGPGPSSVPDDGWLVNWVHSARDQIRASARRATGVHLFMSAPAGAALFLGHRWNTIPGPLTVYDFDGREYFPTFTFV
ncbi:SAVED domain-containing protein [Cellulomonas iranensis]|uniref:SAVED domain-containing protein n=1 Tax=Cellulomonas iranensis TaxID=76862 RepID=UPI001CF2B969|nr:SAVED domain-containing protein [Cellulomonas iranensis]UCN14444.1 SAVED domain-containing protein [Cellulomonas iranensis]